jgi:hypothetical protein
VGSVDLKNVVCVVMEWVVIVVAIVSSTIDHPIPYPSTMTMAVAMAMAAGIATRSTEL